MVLASLDVTVSQADLNQRFGLTPAGVPFSRLKRIDRYGVAVTIRRDAIVADLHQAIDQQIASIAFIRTGQLRYWQTDHALVGCGYEGSYLLLNDPAFPAAPQQVLDAEFMLAWDEFHTADARISHQGRGKPG